jgi:hypothetical protein
MKLESKDIDIAVRTASDSAVNGVFSIKDVINALGSPPEDMKAAEIRVERELDADENLFKDDDKQCYVKRDQFFEGKQFVIVPDELEIENNILYPGHRFCVFCTDEIFPSEVTLIDEAVGNKLSMYEFSHQVTELMPQHILLGSEEIFDFFVAENPANKALIDANTKQRNVSLNVFDMKNFYQKNSFSVGDALLVTVKDWKEGIFRFSFIPGSERKNSKVKAWINELGRAVEMVIDRFEAYLEIPDQLRWAFFMGDKLLWGAEGGSLDEFYKNSDRIEINFDNASHTVLARKIAASYDGDMEIPENIGISSGKTSSLEELLEDVNCPLKAVEIDSYILSQCYQGNPDFDLFFRRCFGMNKLSFADDAQEVIFLNYIDDRWESFFNHYNRVDDKIKAELREQVLEYIDERLDLWETLKAMNIDPEQLPEEPIKKIAEVSVYFIELLRVLNSEKHTLKEEDLEELAESVDRMGETQTAQIEEIQSYLKL